jgi:hypothetical protein
METALALVGAAQAAMLLLLCPRSCESGGSRDASALQQRQPSTPKPRSSFARPITHRPTSTHAFGADSIDTFYQSKSGNSSPQRTAIATLFVGAAGAATGGEIEVGLGCGGMGLVLTIVFDPERASAK